MSYTGVYINLDRSTERRAAMEAQIARYGLAGRYRRFRAADGNILGAPTKLSESEIGCFISHLLVLSEHLDCPVPVHVVEDDVEFSSLMAGTISGLIFADLMTRHDILFLDNVIAPLGSQLLRLLRRGKAAIDRCIVRDAQGNAVGVELMETYHVAGSTSYLINPRSTRKLKAVYDEALAGGAQEPVDLLIRRKGQEGALRVGCVFPFLTSVRLDEVETTIPGRTRDARSIAAGNLLRHAFFVEHDIAELNALAEKLLAPSADPHHRLLARLLGCCLEPPFAAF